MAVVSSLINAGNIAYRSLVSSGNSAVKKVGSAAVRGLVGTGNATVKGLGVAKDSFVRTTTAAAKKAKTTTTSAFSKIKATFAPTTPEFHLSEKAKKYIAVEEKAFKLNTPIPTTDGTKKIQTILFGDMGFRKYVRTYNDKGEKIGEILFKDNSLEDVFYVMTRKKGSSKIPNTGIFNSKFFY